LVTAKERQFGKYRLLEHIATGGMGEIFKARHVDQPESKPPVALKRILKHRSKDKRFVRMFFKEAKIISELDHPNLIHVDDFGKEQEQFYMTMEFVEGHNLDELIKLARQTPKHWSLACGIEVVRQALNGMTYAHEKKDRADHPLNIVHMDLSTHNMMVSKDGQLKILDFGISKAIYDDDQKAYNALRGTYAYMSPEQCREEPVDSRSDLFTLGIVLYELTTLKPLFSRQPSEFMILKAITEGTVPPPSNSQKDFPPELEKVIYKALNVDKELRYQTASEFTEELEAVSRAYNLNKGPEVLVEAMVSLIPDMKRGTPPEAETRPQDKPKVEVSKSGDSTSPKSSDRPQQDQASDKNRRKKDRQSVKSAKRTEPTQEALPPFESIAAGDIEEQLLVQRRNKKHIWTAFFIMLALLICAATYLHYQKTGWLPPQAGVNVYMPDSGTLFVSSIPTGAQVFINRKKQDGATPVRVRDLPLGESISVEIALPGYESLSRTTTLTASKPLDGWVVVLNKK
jgi:serine/threonine-protein kinase